MGTPELLGQLEQLVLVFYQSPTPELDRQLRDFQKSDASWPMSVALLASNHGHVRAFAATTLKTCARRDAHSWTQELRVHRVHELLQLVRFAFLRPYSTSSRNACSSRVDEVSLRLSAQLVLFPFFSSSLKHVAVLIRLPFAVCASLSKHRDEERLTPSPNFFSPSCSQGT